MPPPLGTDSVRGRDRSQCHLKTAAIVAAGQGGSLCSTTRNTYRANNQAGRNNVTVESVNYLIMPTLSDLQKRIVTPIEGLANQLIEKVLSALEQSGAVRSPNRL